MNKYFLLVGIFVLVLGMTLWAIWPSGQTLTESAAGQPQILEPRDIVLYFVDSSGFSLVSEEQQIAGCNDERQCIAQTIEALSSGSQQFQPVLPERTRILGVEVEGDLVRVNFSRDLVDRHPGGSLSELLTVYGLTNTLAVNFPDLRRLQILVEGKIEPTLKGHVDISRPIKAEFRYSYVPKAQGEIQPSPEVAGEGATSEAGAE
jgi:spore germination protein GerM